MSDFGSSMSQISYMLTGHEEECVPDPPERDGDRSAPKTTKSCGANDLATCLAAAVLGPLDVTKRPLSSILPSACSGSDISSASETTGESVTSPKNEVEGTQGAENQSSPRVPGTPTDAAGASAPLANRPTLSSNDEATLPSILVQPSAPATEPLQQGNTSHSAQARSAANQVPSPSQLVEPTLPPPQLTPPTFDPILAQFQPRQRSSYALSGPALPQETTYKPNVPTPLTTRNSPLSAHSPPKRKMPLLMPRAHTVENSRAIKRRVTVDSDDEIQFMGLYKRPYDDDVTPLRALSDEEEGVITRSGQAGKATNKSQAKSDKSENDSQSKKKPEKHEYRPQRDIPSPYPAIGACATCNCQCGVPGTRGHGRGSKVLSSRVRGNLLRLLLGDVQPHAPAANPLAHIQRVKRDLDSWREVTKYIGAPPEEAESVRQTAGAMMRDLPREIERGNLY